MRHRFYSRLLPFWQKKTTRWVSLAMIVLLMGPLAWMVIASHISQAAVASPSVRGTSVATVTYTDPNKVIAAPVTEEGDLLVMIFATDYGTIDAMALPAGFTEISRLDLGSNMSHLMVGTKVASASEPSSYTYTVPTSADSRADLFSIKDADTSLLPAVTNVITPTSTTTHNAPSVAPLGSRDLLLSSVTLESGYTTSAIQPGATTWTPPADMTELTDAQTATTVLTMTTAAKTLTSGGATGVKTFTGTNPNSSRGLAFSIAIPGLRDSKTDVVPDSTVTTNSAWTASGNHTAIDEGVTVTSDYVGTGTGGVDGDTITFGVQNVSNIAQATGVDFHFCAYSASNKNGNLFDTVAANIKINGVAQTAFTVTPAYSTTSTCTWYRGTYGSTSWSQADIDSLQIMFTRSVLGNTGSTAQKDDDIRIVSAYTKVVYTSPPSVSQAAYRWTADDGKPDGTFAGKVDYATGDGPVAATTADFNADQAADMAAVNITSDTVSVLLNTGDGTFAGKVDYATGDGPSSIVSADFNADQIADMAVANQLANTVSILLNNGNGTFASKVDYATGTSSRDTAAVDFNNDGAIDLAVTNNANDTVSILLNNGNGTFASKVDYATGDGPQFIGAADFDGDQIKDLAITNQTTNNISILTGNGNGTFDAKVDYAVGTSPLGVTATDFNSDGAVDLAAANSANDTVSILLNNGNGTFAAKVDYVTGDSPIAVQNADFNSDQVADLVVANLLGDTVSIFLGNSNGTFATKVDYGVGDGPRRVVLADFDKNATVDLGVTSQNIDSMSTLLGNIGAPQSALAAKDTTATAPAAGTPFRLRLNLGVTGGELGVGAAYKLRYQQKSGGVCSTNPADYSDVTSATPIKFYDKASFADGSAYKSSALDPSRSGVVVVGQSYEETNPFSVTAAVGEGEDGLWDFALVIDAGATPANYCLLATKSDGTALNSYAVVPEVTVVAAAAEQSSYRLYHNADSLTPGSPLADDNTAATVAAGDSFRLRQLVRQTSGSTATTEGFKLQVGEKITTCSEATYSASGNTGFQQTAANITGDSAVNLWSNTLNAKTDDDLVASNVVGATGATTTPNIIATQYGFNIPAEATVTGIETSVQSQGSVSALDFDVHLVKAGTVLTAVDRSQGVLLDSETLTYGSASDLWGTTWTPADINSDGFGFAFRASFIALGSPAAHIDYMSVNVHYTMPSSLGYSNNASVADGTEITSLANDPIPIGGAVVPQSYNEDATANVPTAMQVGQNGMWDFSLQSDAGMEGKTYCLRMVKSDGTPFASYAYYPEVRFVSGGPTLSQQLRGGHSVIDGIKRPFNW